MHAFLSKIFGRKKDEKKDEETSPTALSPTQLLDGKFEAVSPTVSPSATKFLELDQANGAHDRGSSSAKVTTRPTSRLDTLPHLSLTFGETRTDGFLLEDEVQALSDSLIGERRLNPLEALILIRSCSQAITAHGLETLGLMHPHWYSSSPETQRRLISQFLHSQSIKNANDNSTTTIDSAIESTRSMHDVAAVLRWGLRHLQLDGDSFGTDAGWYKAFLNAEAAADYPPKAFSEKLAPMIPSAHLELLTTTLELFSSLAAHSEANSISGSKLSKLFGIWLLTARQLEDSDDWFSFYARWERTGRQLEHLFLARIRDVNEDQRMPVRLLELVRKYPYTQGLSSPTTDLQLLPRPRLSTPIYEALFVRIEIEFPPSARKPKTKMNPLNLLADAFATKVTSGEYAELWTKITAASRDGENPLPLSNIFADETIRFLSLVPDSNKAKEAKSPAFSLVQSPSSPSGKSFASMEADVEAANQGSSSHKKFATEPITPLTASAIGNDWEQFSSSGFLDSTPAIGPLVATLFDQDIEKTVPPEPSSALSRRSSRRVKSISRKSVDLSRTPPSKEVTYLPAPTEAGPNELNPVVKAARVEIIQFDEAFIDFWTDSLLDPITAKWPTFIICKFKSTLVPNLTYGAPSEAEQSQKQLKWLVLEQVYTNAKPPPPIMLPTPDPTPMTSPVEQVRAVSPTPSTKRRFNFWSMSRSTSSTSTGSASGKKKAQAGKVNEMGELVEEESAEQVKNKYTAQNIKEESPKKVVARVPVPAEELKSSLSAPVAAAVTATAVAATAAAVTEAPVPAEEEKTPTQEIAAPVHEEVSTPEAATVDETKPVETDVQASALVAETTSLLLVAEGNGTDAPTDSVLATPDVAIVSPTVVAARTLVDPAQAVVVAGTIPSAAEAEVASQVDEPHTITSHDEPIRTFAKEPVSSGVEVHAPPSVKPEAAIPSVELTQTEAPPPPVETAIEGQGITPASVLGLEGAPVIEAVSVVEAAPVIENVLPAPAIEPESTPAPVVETEVAAPVAKVEEDGLLAITAEGAAGTDHAELVNEADDLQSVPEVQRAALTNERGVVAPVEPEQESPPVTEAELTPDVHAPAAETKASTSIITDVDERTPPADDVGILPAHVEVESEAPTEQHSASIVNDGGAAVNELESAPTFTVEPDVSTLDASVSRGTVLEGHVDTSANTQSSMTVAEPVAPVVVESGFEGTSSLESATQAASLVEITVPHPISEVGMAIPDAEVPAASVEPQYHQLAYNAPVVPTVHAVDLVPSAIAAEVFPETDNLSSDVAETIAAPPTVDSVPPIVEVDTSDEVVDSFIDQDAGAGLEYATRSIAHGNKEASKDLQGYDAVTSTTQAEATISAAGEEGIPLEDLASASAGHLAIDFVSHVVAKEGSVPHVEGDVNDVPSAVEVSVSPGVVNEAVASLAHEPVVHAELAHTIVPHVESVTIPSVQATGTEARTLSAEHEVLLKAETDVPQPLANVQDVTHALTADPDVAHSAQSSVDVSGIGYPAGDIEAPVSTDYVETTAELVAAYTEEQPTEHIQEVTSIASPVSDVKVEYADDGPTALGDGAGVLSSENIPVATYVVDATPQPQIEEGHTTVLHELRTAAPAGASEQSVVTEVAEEPTADTPGAVADDSEESQIHVEIAGTDGVRQKQEGGVESKELVTESVPEQAIPKAVDEVTERSVEVAESDPVLPPGLYPTFEQSASHQDILLASVSEIETVPSVAGQEVEAGILAVPSRDIPLPMKDVVEGGAADDPRIPEILSATATNEFSTGESTTTPGESISAFSPPSPSPNEVSAPTVIEQDAPTLDVTTTALGGPASTLTLASEETRIVPTASTPSEDNNNDIAKIAGTPLPSTDAEGSDVQPETAAAVDDIEDQAPDVQEASTPNLAEVIGSLALKAPFISPVPETSEPDVAVEKDEGAPANTTEVGSDALLSNEPGAKVEEVEGPVTVSEETIAPEPNNAETEQFIDTDATPANLLPEELAEQKQVDIHAEVHLSSDASHADTATEHDSSFGIVAPHAAESTVEAEPAAEFKDRATTEPAPSGQQVIEHVELSSSVAPEALSSQSLAEPNQEVAELEFNVAQASPAEVVLAGEEPLNTDQEATQDNTIGHAAQGISAEEVAADIPLSVENGYDTHAEELFAPFSTGAGVPVEMSEPPVLEDESVAAPEPVVEESPVNGPSKKIIEEAAEPIHVHPSEQEVPAAKSQFVAPHEPPVVSTESVIAETMDEAPAEVLESHDGVTHADERASVDPEPLVEDSIVDIPADEPSSTPLASDYPAERAPEPVEVVEPAVTIEEAPREIVDNTPAVEEPAGASLNDVPVESIGPAAAVADCAEIVESAVPVEEPPHEIVDQVPAIDEAVSVAEHPQTMELVDTDAPATFPLAAVEDELAHPDQEIHTAVEEPVQPETLALTAARDSSAPGENVIEVPTEDIPDMNDNGNAQAEIAAVLAAPSVTSVIDEDAGEAREATHVDEPTPAGEPLADDSVVNGPADELSAAPPATEAEIEHASEPTVRETTTPESAEAVEDPTAAEQASPDIVNETPANVEAVPVEESTEVSLEVEHEGLVASHPIAADDEAVAHEEVHATEAVVPADDVVPIVESVGVAAEDVDVPVKAPVESVVEEDVAVASAPAIEAKVEPDVGNESSSKLEEFVAHRSEPVAPVEPIPTEEESDRHAVEESDSHAKETATSPTEVAAPAEPEVEIVGVSDLTNDTIVPRQTVENHSEAPRENDHQEVYEEHFQEATVTSSAIEVPSEQVEEVKETEAPSARPLLSEPLALTLEEPVAAEEAEQVDEHHTDLVAVYIVEPIQQEEIGASVPTDLDEPSEPALAEPVEEPVASALPEVVATSLDIHPSEDVIHEVAEQEQAIEHVGVEGVLKQEDQTVDAPTQAIDAPADEALLVPEPLSVQQASESEDLPTHEEADEEPTSIKATPADAEPSTDDKPFEAVPEKIVEEVPHTEVDMATQEKSEIVEDTSAPSDESRFLIDSEAGHVAEPAVAIEILAHEEPVEVVPLHVEEVHPVEEPGVPDKISSTDQGEAKPADISEVNSAERASSEEASVGPEEISPPTEAEAHEAEGQVVADFEPEKPESTPTEAANESIVRVVHVVSAVDAVEDEDRPDAVSEATDVIDQTHVHTDTINADADVAEGQVEANVQVIGASPDETELPPAEELSAIVPENLIEHTTSEEAIAKSTIDEEDTKSGVIAAVHQQDQVEEAAKLTESLPEASEATATADATPHVDHVLEIAPTASTEAPTSENDSRPLIVDAPSAELEHDKSTALPQDEHSDDAWTTIPAPNEEASAQDIPAEEHDGRLTSVLVPEAPATENIVEEASTAELSVQQISEHTETDAVEFVDDAKAPSIEEKEGEYTQEDKPVTLADVDNLTEAYLQATDAPQEEGAVVHDVTAEPTAVHVIEPAPEADTIASEGLAIADTEPVESSIPEEGNKRDVEAVEKPAAKKLEPETLEVIEQGSAEAAVAKGDEIVEPPSQEISVPADEALGVAESSPVHQISLSEAALPQEESGKAPSAVEATLSDAEPPTNDTSLEAAAVESAREEPYPEVHIAAQKELEIVEETPVPSDESNIPVEPLPEHVDESAVANESVPEQPEEISPPTESEVHEDEAQIVVDVEKEETEFTATKAADDSAIHVVHAESAADAMDNEDDHPVLAEAAPDVIDQVHVHNDAITADADVVEEDAEADVQVVDAPFEEKSFEQTEILPAEELSAQDNEDSGGKSVAEQAPADPVVYTLEEPSTEVPTHHQQAHTEAITPLDDSLPGAPEAAVGTTLQPDHESDDASAESPASAQLAIADAPPAEPDDVAPIVVAQDEPSETASETIQAPIEETPAQNISAEAHIVERATELVPDVPATETTVEEASTMASSAQQAFEHAETVTAEFDDTKVHSNEEKEEQDTQEDGYFRTEDAGASNEARLQETDAAVEGEATVISDACEAEPSILPAVEAASEADTIAREADAAPDVEPAESKIPEESALKGEEEEHEHVVEVDKHTAAEEVEPEIADKPEAEASAPIDVAEAAAVEPTPTPAVEDNAVDEPPVLENKAAGTEDADTSNELQSQQTETPVQDGDTTTTPTIVAELSEPTLLAVGPVLEAEALPAQEAEEHHDAVGEPSAVDQEAPAEVTTAPAVEDDVAPGEALAEGKEINTEPDATLADDKVAPVEDVAVPKVNTETTVEHAAEALDAIVIADTTPAEPMATEPSTSETSPVHAEQEKAPAAEPTTMPEMEEEIFEPPAVLADAVTKLPVSAQDEAEPEPAPITKVNEDVAEQPVAREPEVSAPVEISELAAAGSMLAPAPEELPIDGPSEVEPEQPATEVVSVPDVEDEVPLDEASPEEEISIDAHVVENEAALNNDIVAPEFDEVVAEHAVEAPSVDTGALVDAATVAESSVPHTEEETTAVTELAAVPVAEDEVPRPPAAAAVDVDEVHARVEDAAAPEIDKEVHERAIEVVEQAVLEEPYVPTPVDVFGAVTSESMPARAEDLAIGEPSEEDQEMPVDEVISAPNVDEVVPEETLPEGKASTELGASVAGSGVAPVANVAVPETDEMQVEHVAEAQVLGVEALSTANDVPEVSASQTLVTPTEMEKSQTGPVAVPVVEDGVPDPTAVVEGAATEVHAPVEVKDADVEPAPTTQVVHSAREEAPEAESVHDEATPTTLPLQTQAAEAPLPEVVTPSAKLEAVEPSADPVVDDDTPDNSATKEDVAAEVPAYAADVEEPVVTSVEAAVGAVVDLARKEELEVSINDSGVTPDTGTSPEEEILSDAVPSHVADDSEVSPSHIISNSMSKQVSQEAAVDNSFVDDAGVVAAHLSDVPALAQKERTTGEGEPSISAEGPAEVSNQAAILTVTAVAEANDGAVPEFTETTAEASTTNAEGPDEETLVGRAEVSAVIEDQTMGIEPEAEQMVETVNGVHYTTSTQRLAGEDHEAIVEAPLTEALAESAESHAPLVNADLETLIIAPTQEAAVDEPTATPLPEDQTPATDTTTDVNHAAEANLVKTEAASVGLQQADEHPIHALASAEREEASEPAVLITETSHPVTAAQEITIAPSVVPATLEEGTDTINVQKDDTTSDVATVELEGVIFHSSPQEGMLARVDEVVAAPSAHESEDAAHTPAERPVTDPNEAHSVDIAEESSVLSAEHLDTAEDGDHAPVTLVSEFAEEKLSLNEVVSNEALATNDNAIEIGTAEPPLVQEINAHHESAPAAEAEIAPGLLPIHRSHEAEARVEDSAGFDSIVISFAQQDVPPSEFVVSTAESNVYKVPQLAAPADSTDPIQSEQAAEAVGIKTNSASMSLEPQADPDADKENSANTAAVQEASPEVASAMAQASEEVDLIKKDASPDVEPSHEEEPCEAEVTPAPEKDITLPIAPIFEPEIAHDFEQDVLREEPAASPQVEESITPSIVSAALVSDKPSEIAPPAEHPVELTEELASYKATIQIPVDDAIIGASMPEAAAEPENLVDHPDSSNAAETFISPDEPSPAEISLPATEVVPTVDDVASSEVESIANEDTPVAPLGHSKDKNLVENGNGHHAESDESGIRLDQAENVVLPEDQDVIGAETSLGAAAAAAVNVNGHVKNETDITLVESAPAPILDDSEFDKTSAHAEPLTAEVAEANHPPVHDDSALSTSFALDKVEEILTTTGGALDVDSIAKSFSLSSATHDEPATKLTTTAIDNGDEE